MEPEMSHKTPWASVALALLFGVSLFVAAETPDIGQKAPDFTLSTPEGHPLSLSTLSSKGTVVLIVLRGFPGYQCPYCQRQVHDFVTNSDRFAALGVQVLLVYPGPSADLDQRAKEFLAKQNELPANLHLVIDPNYKFTNQYGLRWDAPKETAYPTTFLIDRHGVVFFRKISRAHGDRTTAEDVLSELVHTKAGH
jgi:peroxiredoxin